MRNGVYRKLAKSLIQCGDPSFSARIPHQSPLSPDSGDSFPPGEALGAPAPHQLTDKSEFMDMKKLAGLEEKPLLPKTGDCGTITENGGLFFSVRISHQGVCL